MSKIDPKDLDAELIAQTLEEHNFPLGAVEINKLLADIYRRLDKLERAPVAGEVANG